MAPFNALSPENTPSQSHNSLASIISEFKALAQRTSQDRKVYIPKDIFLQAVVVGEGLIAGKTDSDDEDAGADSDVEEAQAKEAQESLFLEEEKLPVDERLYRDRDGLPDEDEDLIPEEEELDDAFAENIQFLNSLKGHIVSCLHSDAVQIQSNALTYTLAGKLSFTISVNLSISCNSSKTAPASWTREDRIQHPKSTSVNYDRGSYGSW